MTDPDAPTEAFRTATRRLERIPPDRGAPWECPRCRGPVEPLSQGHYQQDPRTGAYGFRCEAGNRRAP